MTGQEHILNYLKKSVEKNRVSHAYLFVGTEESERKKMALKFAKFLGCQEPDITQIQVLENKQEILIGQIRELRRYLSLSSHSSPYKAAIIHEAEKMNPEAANALLKTLEEPKGSAVLILTTNTLSSLPGTIVSRCEEIKFREAPLDKISKSFIKQEYTDVLARSLNDIFKFIEKISRNETKILVLLNSWLFYFREKAKQEAKYVKVLKEIQKTKNLISSTNINRRLALENLALEISCSEIEN